MTQVRIPPVLRTQVGGQKELSASGATLGALLEDIIRRYPDMREQLIAPDGGLHRFVNIYVNGQDVRYLQGLDTPVGEREQVIILPAMAGGA